MLADEAKPLFLPVFSQNSRACRAYAVVEGRRPRPATAVSDASELATVDLLLPPPGDRASGQCRQHRRTLIATTLQPGSPLPRVQRHGKYIGRTSSTCEGAWIEPGAPRQDCRPLLLCQLSHEGGGVFTLSVTAGAEPVPLTQLLNRALAARASRLTNRRAQVRSRPPSALQPRIALCARSPLALLSSHRTPRSRPCRFSTARSSASSPKPSS